MQEAKCDKMVGEWVQREEGRRLAQLRVSPVWERVRRHLQEADTADWKTTTQITKVSLS